MMDFYKALAHVLESEGGYVNDPDDSGGATNRGVIQVNYDDWRDRKGLPRRSVRLIEGWEVTEFYRTRYWDQGRCPSLRSPLNFVHFDSCVNHGIGNGAKLLQRALGVPDDGKIGPVTLSAADAANPMAVALALLIERARFYVKIVQARPSQAKFLVGWILRLYRVYREARDE